MWPTKGRTSEAASDNRLMDLLGREVVKRQYATISGELQMLTAIALGSTQNVFMLLSDVAF